MRITPDTNVLIRAIVDDDPDQAMTARRILADAERVAITLPALCELVWVLAKAFGIARGEVVRVIDTLTAAQNVVTDEAAVEAGLAMLSSGGDFADGVIAHAGRALGGPMLVSFDRKAVRILQARGEQAELLG